MRTVPSRRSTQAQPAEGRPGPSDDDDDGDDDKDDDGVDDDKAGRAAPELLLQFVPTLYCPPTQTSQDQ